MYSAPVLAGIGLTAVSLLADVKKRIRKMVCLPLEDGRFFGGIILKSTEVKSNRSFRNYIRKHYRKMDLTKKQLREMGI